VKEIHPTTGSEPSQLLNVNGTLFFVAYDADDDLELWRSDGTEMGTVRVKDINLTGSSNPELYSTGTLMGLYFFTADDGVHGREPWVTDGTEAGTRLLKDIHPSGDSSASGFRNIAGLIYFKADDGAHGRELWITNGTEQGTYMALDLIPGPQGSSLGFSWRVNKVWIGAGDDGVHGRELWAIDTRQAPIPAVSEWSLTGLALLLLCAATLVLRNRSTRMRPVVHAATSSVTTRLVKENRS
jgi:ELWxxDGT repeat protein